MYRKDQASNEFHFRYGFFIGAYKKEYYWWGLFQMFRKAFLVMVIDLSNSYNAYLRTFLVLIVFISTMLIESLLQPRYEASLSRSLNLV
jgi:hypothetical protein